MRGAKLRTLALALAGVSAMGLVTPFATAAFAQDANRRNFNIPARDMAGALEAFGRQSGRDILFDRGQVVGRRSNAVRGLLEPGDALRRLVSGSGLSVSAPNAATFVVGRGPGEAEAGSAAAVDQVLGADGTPEILVVGSRSQNVDIRRTEDDVQPYVVLGRDQIRSSQSTNLEDFLRTRLPMNAAQGSNGQTAALGNVSSINLRGLGSNQTLILIDGRRTPSVFNGGQLNQSDLNGIPLSAVERIEVLPATASAIYGGGATGGAVNVILRRDYSGIEVGLTYGDTFAGGAANRRVDIAGGLSLFGGRTRITVAASHSEADPLFAGQRDFTRRARERLFANNPSAITTASSPLTGTTPNLCAATISGTFAFCNGQPLVLDNGTPLNASITFVPSGYAGVADGGVALLANAGRYNLGLSGGGQGARQGLLNGPTIDSVTANLRQDITSNLEAYASFSLFQNHGKSRSGGFGTAFPLPANAPNNPFNTNVAVLIPEVDIAPPIIANSDSLSFGAGLIWRLGHGWVVSGEHQENRAEFFRSLTGSVVNQPALTAAIANGTIDILQDFTRNPQALRPFLLLTPDTVAGPFVNHQRISSVRISGPLFRLPGGPITATALLERRRENTDTAYQENRSTAGVITTRAFPEYHQGTDSAYLEGVFPVFGPENHISFVRSLELRASVRYDDYNINSPNPAFLTVASRDATLPSVARVNTESSAVSYLAGLAYSPFEGLVLRGSYSTGFLPPLISQLVQTTVPNSMQQLSDPKRGNTPGLVGPLTLITGGSTSLEPEHSNSWSVGAIVTPPMLPGFRFSVDYTHIRKTGEITQLLPQVILNIEDSLPAGRVVRDPLTAADTALGYTGGRITAINASLINASYTEVEAVDFQVDYDLPTRRFGNFHIFAVATWQNSLRRQASPIAPVIESVDFNGGPLRWRGNGGVTWNSGPWSVAWSAQFYNSYLIYAPGSAQSAITSAVANQGARRIPSQIYNDLSIGFRFADSQRFSASALAPLEVRFGVQNLFDKSPPIDVVQFYSTFGDPRLRRFTLSLRAQFR